MSALTHPLQHISEKDHDRCSRRSRRYCQHWSRCADGIDGLAGEEEELTKLVERLDKATTAYGMEEQCPEDQAYDQTTTQRSK